jgi:hypothetical protein
LRYAEIKLPLPWLISLLLPFEFQPPVLFLLSIPFLLPLQFSIRAALSGGVRGLNVSKASPIKRLNLLGSG